jgi:hypothetical protein
MLGSKFYSEPTLHRAARAHKPVAAYAVVLSERRLTLKLTALGNGIVSM